jgi:hypothetical protein
MQDNIQWIKQENKLVVGSQARILYADAEGRVKILRFNQAIAKGILEPFSRTRPSRCFRNRLSLQRHQTSTTDRVLQPIWLFKT